jgi:transcriptional regulator with XRE-family HTH domain
MIKMTMGEYIYKLRNEEGLTQEQLGHKLVPPVNRGAINKWEKGRVVNIKREYIEQLSTIFGIEPTELMCFEFKYDEVKISKEVKLAEDITEYFGKDAIQLLQHFMQLNKSGRRKALNSIVDLTEIPKYTE